MNWCFARVNNRFAEIYFERLKKGPKILGHAYIKPEELKKPVKWLIMESQKFQFTYKKGQYKKKNA